MKSKKLNKKHLELLNVIADTMINSPKGTNQFLLYVDTKVTKKDIKFANEPAIPAKYHGSKAAKTIGDYIHVGLVFVKDNVKFSCAVINHGPYVKALTFIRHNEEINL